MVDSDQSTPKEIFKVIPGIKTTKVFQNYYLEEIENEIQGRAKKEEIHKIEQVKVLHKVARATGRINLSSCQAHEEIVEVKAKKEQIDSTVAQWTDGLKAIDVAVIENAEIHHITPEEQS